MSKKSSDYTFNFTSNTVSVIKQITYGVADMSEKVNESGKIWDSLTTKIDRLNQVSEFINDFSKTVSTTLAPGAALNASLHELSAASGAAGENLKMIEKSARESAKTFGGSASQSMETYKLLLRELTSELTKSPEALEEMGNHVAILSKTMGGDAVSALEVLTTAMNQYGVSFDDPAAASEKMSDMMNVMAAAGREGSTELLTIKSALEQCGAAAQASGISFEETNAAIQVLDKAGKQGAEGGIAMRDVLTTLAQGSFLPESVQKELTTAGIDMTALGDNSLSLADRLRTLQPVMDDATLFSKIFGQANADAAMAMVGGADEMDRYAEAITGTNTAYEQAEIVMESYNEKKSRIQAKFEDIKIGIFNASGEFGLWVENIAGAITPLADITSHISTVIGGIKTLKNLNFAGIMAGFSKAVAHFKIVAVSACKSVGLALKSIPVFGWIIAVVAAIGALFVYFWRTSAKFRGVLKGIWEACKSIFSNIWNLAKSVFSSLGDLFASAFRLDRKGISAALGKMGDSFKEFGSDAAEAFNKAYDAEISKSEQKEGRQLKKPAKVSPFDLASKNAPDEDKQTNPIVKGLHGIGGSADKADKIRNINISIEKLVEKFEIHTTNLKEDSVRLKDMIAETLLGAVNDANYAL